MNDDAFEALVPLLTPSIPVDPTERDYLIKLIVTIRDCLFVPRYYCHWDLFGEERNYIPQRTIFEPFLEHFTNTYNRPNSDIIQIRLATGTPVTKISLRALRTSFEDIYLGFIIHVYNLIKKTLLINVKAHFCYFSNFQKISSDPRNRH